MPTYDFTLVLSGPTELTDDLADKLFAAGRDDATPSSSGGAVSIDFGREAGDLESAIRSAIANEFADDYLVARGKISDLKMDEILAEAHRRHDAQNL